MPRQPRTRRTAGITGDSFQNFITNTGIGTNNVSSGGSYGFNPISRNHVLLEWAYRGSWVVRKTIDCPADDMVRQGTTINDDMPPDRIEEMQNFWSTRQIWTRLNSTLKWSRLYGGCLAVIVIDGQKFNDPLRMRAVSKGGFKGLLVLDRWMVSPDFSKLISDPGSPDYGNPVYYNVVADARTLPSMKIHHSRVLRFDGVELPYWQKIAENGWGLSVLEPLWDRLLAFDSATQGAAQLIYRAHLRTIKLPKLRENIALGGKSYNAVIQNLQMIRLMQANEGLTLLDAEDTFETQTYSFAGLSDMLVQFSQQVSGAADVPLTRMFGQSPAGMNSTGESDLRNYYDGLKSQQEMKLRDPCQTLYELTHRSLYGEPLPNEFGFTFNPLWQLTDEQKVTINGQVTQAVAQALEAQIIDTLTAARELRQASAKTGVFSNITDEYLDELEANPPEAQMGEESGVPDMPPQGAEGGLAAGAAPEQGDAVDPAQIIASLAARGPQDGTAAERVAQLAVAPPPPDHAAKLAEFAIKSRSGRIAKRAVKSRSDRIAAFVVSKRGERQDAPDEQATEPFPLGTATRDTYPVHDFHGLRLVIETLKDQQRTGNGWAVNMPCEYGYISRTASAEGPMEQMDVFAGDDLTAPKVWVIEQNNPDTKTFDEHKVMVGFAAKDAALAAYHAAFSDGRGPERVRSVKEMAAIELPAWLAKWPYGKTVPERG